MSELVMKARARRLVALNHAARQRSNIFYDPERPPVGDVRTGAPLIGRSAALLAGHGQLVA